MKTNPFYITWGIVTLLLVGGAGFFLFSSKSAYDATKGSFDDKESTIRKLQKKTPYPDAKSVAAMEDLAASYKSSVEALYNSLAGFQRPLRNDLVESDFPKLILDKLTAFRKAAEASGMTVKAGADGAEFYFGMDDYRTTSPVRANLPLLNYQLEAIERLLAIMVESGVEKLISLKREPLPAEVKPGEPDPTEGQSVVRHELRVQFTSSHDAFQKFMNALANDDQFFFLLRVVRVDNSSPMGPAPRSDVDLGGDSIPFVNSDGDPPPPEIQTQADAIADTDEMITFMRSQGFSPVQKDAKVLLGDEKVEVFAVIDVARFPTPAGDGESADNAAAGAAADENK